MEPNQQSSPHVVVVAGGPDALMSGLEGLARVERVRPRDAVATILGVDPDLVLLRGQPEELAAIPHRVRRCNGCSSLPFVGVGPAEDAERWLARGNVDDFIPDAASPRALAARLEGWGRARRFERQVALLEQRLEEGRSETSRAIAGLSRELRAPLNPIMGFADLLLERGLGHMSAEEFERYVGFIQGSGAQMIKFLDDLLEFSRLCSGELALSRRWADLSELVVWSANALAPLCHRRGIVMSVPAEPLGLIHADPGRLRQVLVTLLSEAIRATPARGEVALDVLHSDSCIEFYVRGGGASRAVASSDPVEHLARAALLEDQGFGMALVHSTVRAHGGRFAAVPAFPSGTVYVVSIPQPEETHEQPVPKRAAGKSEKSLIGD